MGVEEDLRLILFRDLIGYPLYPIVSLLMPGGKISCLLFFIKDIDPDELLKEYLAFYSKETEPKGVFLYPPLEERA